MNEHLLDLALFRELFSQDEPLAFIGGSPP
jgi:hypothetical protein